MPQHGASTAPNGALRGVRNPRGDACRPAEGGNLPARRDFAGLPIEAGHGRTRMSRAWLGRLLGRLAALEARMVPFFVQIKCHLGKSYEVASKLADAEIASEIYSTAGEFDLLAKFYVEAGTDIGHFVNQKVQTIPGIQDTRTIITFKAF
jgi:DNA-binding Lrp family transcriptional regulator